MGEEREYAGGTTGVPPSEKGSAVYARSTTISTDPSQVDEGIAFVRDEVLPAITAMQGCRGLSMLVDRGSGRCITTTSWDSEEALQASAETARPLRERAVELLGGEATVEIWEIASMHRAHHTGAGTCVRAAWSRVPTPQVENALDFYKYRLLPQIEELDGFVSASLMIDKAAGRAVTSVAFESREAMEGTRDQADYLRAASTNEANVEFLDVCEFELAIAHLHVPELV